MCVCASLIWPNMPADLKSYRTEYDCSQPLLCNLFICHQDVRDLLSCDYLGLVTEVLKHFRCTSWQKKIQSHSTLQD